MENNSRNILLAYVIKTIHLAYFVTIAIGPYITNSVPYLLLLIILYISAVTSWYLIGNCFLTDIENYLLGIKNEPNKDDSFITIYLGTLFGSYGKYMPTILSIIPLINTMVCLIKIYRIKCKCK